MTRFGVVVVIWLSLAMAMASMAAAAPGEWTLAVPAGWRTDAAADKRLHDQLSAAQVELEQVEVRVWLPKGARAGAGTGLVVEHMVHPIGPMADVQREIDNIDSGLVSGATQGAPSDTSRRVANSLETRDLRIDNLRGLGVHVRMVRHYQLAEDGLHVLVTICSATSDLAPCSAALDSVRFTVADPLPLDWGNRVAYRVGQASIPAVGIVIFLVWWMRRRSRERRELGRGLPNRPPGFPRP